MDQPNVQLFLQLSCITGGQLRFVLNDLLTEMGKGTGNRGPDRHLAQ
jgi:hypothetical protein